MSVKERARLKVINEQLAQEHQEKQQRLKDELSAVTEASLRQAQVEIKILKRQMEM
jgi:hypothetical protein